MHIKIKGHELPTTNSKRKLYLTGLPVKPSVLPSDLPCALSLKNVALHWNIALSASIFFHVAHEIL